MTESNNTNGRVQGKTAMVTGGASGLGKATAALLAREGANVIITDIANDAGLKAAKEIGVVFMEHDVANEADWLRVINATIERYGELNILVNNAGIAEKEPGDPETTDFDAWCLVQTINAGGVFLGCKHGIAAMRLGGGGSIVNLSSIAALVATPFLTAYGASKAAVRQLTMSVSLHCAQQGYPIRCNSIHPGQILTPMLEGLFDDVSTATGQDKATVRGEFVKKIPQGEFGEPIDVAYGVLYLASDESKHVTGEQLVIDGGMNTHP